MAMNTFYGATELATLILCVIAAAEFLNELFGDTEYYEM
jgi:hypothetical protein